jgi:hypothetical protein
MARKPEGDGKVVPDVACYIRHFPRGRVNDVCNAGTGWRNGRRCLDGMDNSGWGAKGLWTGQTVKRVDDTSGIDVRGGIDNIDRRSGCACPGGGGCTLFGGRRDWRGTGEGDDAGEDEETPHADQEYWRTGVLLDSWGGDDGWDG